MSRAQAVDDISRIGAAALPGWAQALLFVVGVAGAVAAVVIVIHAWRAGR